MQEMRMAEFEQICRRAWAEVDNFVSKAFHKGIEYQWNIFQVATIQHLHEITCKSTRNLLTLS